MPTDHTYTIFFRAETWKSHIFFLALMWLYHRIMWSKDLEGIANSADPQQTVPLLRLFLFSRNSLIWVCSFCLHLSVHKLRIITVKCANAQADVCLHRLYMYMTLMSQLMRLWHLSQRRPAKAQASFRIRAVSPDPLLLAHMKYGNRQRVRPI